MVGNGTRLESERASALQVRSLFLPFAEKRRLKKNNKGVIKDLIV